MIASVEPSRHGRIIHDYQPQALAVSEDTGSQVVTYLSLAESQTGKS